MKKVELDIKNEDLKIIIREAKKGKNAKVRDKASVLYLRYLGKTESEIKDRIGLTVKTIVSYVRNYNNKGISSIFNTDHKGQVSKLNEFKDTIIKDFNNSPPNTIDEANMRIEKLTGIKRTNTSIILFLKKTAFLTKKQEASQLNLTKKNKKNT